MATRFIRNSLLVLGLTLLAVLMIGFTTTAPANSTAASGAATLAASASNPSPEAQRALAFIAGREGIPVEDLLVANEFRRDAPLLRRMFQAVTVLDQRSGRFFAVLVDRDSGQVEDREAVEVDEARAHDATYGRLQPTLYERLQQLGDTDMVTVTIVTAAGPGQSLGERERAARAALAAKYPEARDAIARGGKPMDVADPALAARIYKEYVALLKAAVPQRVQPLVAALEAQGYTVRTTPGLPTVTISAPKRVILALAQRGDVGTIFLAERGRGHTGLSTAVPTNRAPAVRARGYDGSGVKIAILENDNVDFDDLNAGGDCPAGTHNCFLHPGAQRDAYNGLNDSHATLVASAAASNHSTYRGMAPGATIVSAGMYGSFEQDNANALDWALDPVGGSADVVNSSYGWCGSPYLDQLDWAWDYYVLTSARLLVGLAGNNDACSDYNLWTPSKGWNVLTVGAYDDKNNQNWSDDTMAGFSAWINPVS